MFSIIFGYIVACIEALKKLMLDIQSFLKLLLSLVICK